MSTHTKQMNNADFLQRLLRKPPSIQAWGVFGSRQGSWKRTFRSYEAMERWAEQTGAYIQGTKEIQK